MVSGEPGDCEPIGVKRWTFELAQVFNRTRHEAKTYLGPEHGSHENVVASEWRWPETWQEAIYDEVFSDVEADHDVLAGLVTEEGVMELHNCGSRRIPQVDAMREQAIAEFYDLDREESVGP